MSGEREEIDRLLTERSEMLAEFGKLRLEASAAIRAGADVIKERDQNKKDYDGLFGQIQETLFPDDDTISIGGFEIIAERLNKIDELEQRLRDAELERAKAEKQRDDKHRLGVMLAGGQDRLAAELGKMEARAEKAEDERNALQERLDGRAALGTNVRALQYLIGAVDDAGMASVLSKYDELRGVVEANLLEPG